MECVTGGLSWSAAYSPENIFSWVSFKLLFPTKSDERTMLPITAHRGASEPEAQATEKSCNPVPPEQQQLWVTNNSSGGFADHRMESKTLGKQLIKLLQL